MPKTVNDHDLLIRLDEKVTAINAKLDGLTDDHESRIRALEKWRWISAGLGTAGGAGIAALLQRLLS
jgi:hypothetical protein